MRRPITLRTLTVVASGLLALGGCSADPPGESSAASTVVIADTGTPVQSVLAHVYARVLAGSGASVRIADVDGLDSALEALDDATVSILPGFGGTLLGRLDPGSPARTADDVYSDLARALPEWLTLGDAGLAENGSTVAVSPMIGSSLTEATVSALAPRCAALSVYVDPGSSGESSAVEQSAVTADLAETYDCRFAREAAGADDADVVVRAATDRIVEPGSEEVLLADDEDGFRAQPVVPVMRKQALGESATRALQVVAGELTTADLASMVNRVRAGADPTAVADEWSAGVTTG